MKDRRSSSQIVTGFLPEQTVDLRGSVWKVKGWRAPLRLNTVDTQILREEILRAAYEWIGKQDQKKFLENLQRGHNLEAYTLEEHNGVNVEEFPKQWICRKCKLYHKDFTATCRCGSVNSKRQLPFVAFHSCGQLSELSIPACPTHGRTYISLPKTASLTQIQFFCSESGCNWSPKPGLPYQRCRCGQGMNHNIHRAAKVYTSRSVVIVNPPSSEALKVLNQSGGVARASTWVLEGMATRSVTGAGKIPALKQSLLEQNIPEEQVKVMLRSIGVTDEETETYEIPSTIKAEFEYQAKMLGIATLDSRLMIPDLIENASTTEPFKERYESKYYEAINTSGLKSVDLLEKFPIFTGRFGYTRGSIDPGTSTINPFSHHDRRQRNVYPVYGDLAETEALLLHLNPEKVLLWLQRLGYTAEYDAKSSPHQKILSLLADARHGNEARAALKTMIHSYSHRFIRTLAIYAGIDRNAMGEMIFEYALSFIVYSVPRGDFVLGGMRAVFERELDALLDEVRTSEHRCALDPGCAKSRGACMACLHIGEPSCAHYNRYLSRKSLFGEKGYLHSA